MRGPHTKLCPKRPHLSIPPGEGLWSEPHPQARVGGPRLRAASSAMPRPSAQTRRAPAALPLAEAPANPRAAADERALVGEAGAGPHPAPPGPPPGGGVAAAVAGPEAASPAPLRAGRCGAVREVRGGSGGTMELGARTGECALRPASSLSPASIPAGSGPGGGGPPQPRGQVNLLHRPGAWAVGGAQCGPAHPPRRLPAVAPRPLAPVRASRPQGWRPGLGPRRTHERGAARRPVTSRPSGLRAPSPHLGPVPACPPPGVRPSPLGSALPRCCGNPRSRSWPWPSGWAPGRGRQPGSGALRGRGAAGSLGRDASSGKTLPAGPAGPGASARGESLCLSRCAGSRAMAISSWFSLCKGEFPGGEQSS